jgi:rhamnosyltransferase
MASVPGLLNSADLFRVCAIVVTFWPNYDVLRDAIDAIIEQVKTILIIDNTGTEELSGWIRNHYCGEQLVVISFAENRGLGEAQNIGIRWAKEQGFTHVLLLDQDSIVAPNMVPCLKQALVDLQARNLPVAAVGPRQVDQYTGFSPPFVRFGRFFVKRYQCTGKPDYVPVDFLISSGMLTPLVVFEHIGGLDEGLFIDNVDLDWCFRVRHVGMWLYGVCNAVMIHRLGDQVVRIWLGRWIHIHRHSPLRQYYIMRNRILLYRRSYSPSEWISHDIFRLLFKWFMFALFFSPRLLNIRMMWCGIVDGLKGKDGKFVDEI